jgi:predicted hotdog family 3-hydroxylacyl-ACP dehydratase
VILDRAWIEAHVPHQGSMCLLDRIEHWTATEITCIADSHRHPDNPLRGADGLGPSNGIEYAAQAMALHGALLGGEGEGARQGYLASVRDVAWQVPRLDAIASPLTVRAQRLSGHAQHVLYQFSLEADGRELLTGRATVVLDSAIL